MSIDYAKAQRQFRAQKTALTKAVNTGETAKIIAAATKAVKQWDETGSWPDSWSNWDRALSDAFDRDRAAYVRGQTADKPDAGDYELEELRNR